MSDRYEIERPLDGDSGTVFLAKDTVLDRRVVLRFAPPGSPEPKGRLEPRGRIDPDARRARAKEAARVRHPGVAMILDMGEDEERGHFLVFEYVEGPTLKERLAEGPMEPELVRKLAAELGAALAAVHEAGCTHGRIRTDNVVLSKDGARILDLGVAREIGADASADRAALASMLSFARLPAVITESAPQAIESSPISLAPSSLLPRKRTQRLQNIFAAIGLLVIIGLVVFGRRSREDSYLAPDAAASASVSSQPSVLPPRNPPRRPRVTDAQAADAGSAPITDDSATPPGSAGSPAATPRLLSP